ncbi:PDR/VanB family oxidoreductase [Azohydromonas australica]|uniref:PDR/VanB family oxidoreductase n=1 Tax=Azohydromonas australica TaxID=364039 RepID=UPI000403C9B3|nr:PDR/VanB family oxidoreductase [Azohydromonas australica]
MERRPFVVRRKWETAEGICGLELVPEDGSPLGDIEPGAHVEFILERPGLPPLVRQYSLCNAPGERDAYVFGIKKEPSSRGGSLHLHSLNEGSRLVLGATRNHFPLAADAQSHLLLAGGIGITPMLSMMQALGAQGRRYELHYFVRGSEHVAFKDRLEAARQQGLVHIHAGLDPAQTRKVLQELLDQPAAGAHAYCCGPGVFMDTVEEITAAQWPAQQVHFERFQADTRLTAQPEQAFTVVLHKRGTQCQVEPGQSIVSALAHVGCEVDTSCEQGVCGTCLTRVLEGTPDHRDAYLSKAERQSNTQILPCVSRSLSPVLVLDL